MSLVDMDIRMDPKDTHTEMSSVQQRKDTAIAIVIVIVTTTIMTMSTPTTKRKTRPS